MNMLNPAVSRVGILADRKNCFILTHILFQRQWRITQLLILNICSLSQGRDKTQLFFLSGSLLQGKLKW